MITPSIPEARKTRAKLPDNRQGVLQNDRMACAGFFKIGSMKHDISRMRQSCYLDQIAMTTLGCCQSLPHGLVLNPGWAGRVCGSSSAEWQGGVIIDGVAPGREGFQLVEHPCFLSHKPSP